MAVSSSIPRGVTRAVSRAVPGGLFGVGGAYIRLTPTSVSEDAIVGDLVGILSVVNGSGSYTFSVTADPNSKFILDLVDNTRLELEATVDYTTSISHAVTIEADNGVDPPISRVFTVLVEDKDAPSITSSASVSVNENAVLAHTLAATDDTAVTWSIIGGADQAQFEISGTTLRWAGNDTQDWEVPLDADANNTYVVQVRATDAFSNASNQTITVTVTDVVEGGGGGDGTQWDFSDAANSGHVLTSGLA
jgi:hypothetical protein